MQKPDTGYPTKVKLKSRDSELRATKILLEVEGIFPSAYPCSKSQKVKMELKPL